MRQKKTSKERSLSDRLRQILAIVCLLVFLFSLFMLGKRLYEYHHDHMQNKKIQDKVSSVNPAGRFDGISKQPDTGVSQQPSSGVIQQEIPYQIIKGNPGELNTDGILSIYAELKKTNSDMIGWIWMPGFKNPINYPVMQSKDNEFYLKRDFYRNTSHAGAIFMDFQNNSDNVDRHIVIYGHAMRDNSMFGNLNKYADKSENYTKYTKIYLDLMNTSLEYEVFSTYFEKDTYNYRQTTFNSDKEFKEFIERIKSKSVHNYGVNLTAMDRILTLSTCNSSHGDNFRSIIHARLVRQIIYDGPTVNQGMAKTEIQPAKNPVSANDYLQKLLLKYDSGNHHEDVALKPRFDTKVIDYTAEIPSVVNNVSLVVQTSDPKAKMEVRLNGKEADFHTLPLVSGGNVITVKVTSRDSQYSHTYTIKVEQQPDPNASTPTSQATVAPSSNPGAEPKTTPVPSPSDSPDNRHEATPSTAATPGAEPDTSPAASPEAGSSTTPDP